MCEYRSKSVISICFSFFYRNRVHRSPQKRSISLKVTDVDSTTTKRLPFVIDKQLPSPETPDAKAPSEEIHHQINPSLTLISVFSSDAPPNVHVQRTTSPAPSNVSKSSQLFSLFRIPKSVDTNSTSSNTLSSQPVQEPTVDLSLNRSKSATETSKKGKQEKNNRIVSFVRYLFCHLVPARADATVTPMAIDRPLNQEKKVALTSSPSPTLPAKVYRLLFV